MNYFVYGTLLDRDVRFAVLGDRADVLAETPATLLGHRCVAVPSATYPTLRHDAGGRVAGLVVAGVDGEMARRLADYEGDEYAVGFVGVHTEAGVRMRARCFLPRRRPRCAAPWDFARWRRCHKPAFMLNL